MPSCNCKYYNIIVFQSDLDDSTGNSLYPDNTLYIQYVACDGNPYSQSYSSAGNYNNDICVSGGTTVIPYYYKNDSVVSGGSINSQAYNTLIDCCPVSSATPTPTPTRTPTPTPIVCGSGVTTGSYYYTDCCGNFINGTQVGLVVSLDYSKPSNGLTKLNVVATTSCPSPTPTKTPTKTPTPTPTTSVTPTLTKTPNQTPSVTPSPSRSGSFKIVNNCDFFTIFPLGVECVTVSQSTGEADGILSLNITGGTSPYTILWNNGQRTKTQFNLLPGDYPVTVIDYYGDFTASTICSIVGPTVTPTLTPTLTPTPSPTPTYPNLCLLITSSVQSFTPTQFVLSGTQNGKPKWISGVYTMYWNNSVVPNRWEISNYPVFGGILVSSNQGTIPTSSWSVLGITGGQPQPTVVVQQGTCPDYVPLVATVQKTDDDCSTQNTGSIVISANGGASPYQYSINGGYSYQNSNIFNSLAANTYSVVTIDGSGNSVNNSVVIDNTNSNVAYTVYVQNLTTNSLSSNIEQATWQLSVNPPLPVGSSLTLTLNINSYQYVKGPGTGTISSTNVVRLNGVTQTVTSTTSIPSTTNRPNCSPDVIDTNLINEVYSLTIANGDVVTGTSTSNLTITAGQVGVNGCVTELEQDINVFVQNATLQGCTCCSLTIDSQSSGGITDHILSEGQGENTPTYYEVVCGLGNSEISACSDRSYDYVRLMNAQTFTTGVAIYTGSPGNPTLATSSFIAGPDTGLYYLNNGIVGQPVLGPGNAQEFC